MILLTGFSVSCGPLTGSSQSSKTASSQNSVPSAETLISPDNASQKPGAVEVPAPVALPPSFGDRPAQPGQMKTQTMPNGLPALQPKGVNVGNLFADNISDTDARFNRLENAVQDLRREFESFKPAIVRLVAVESDIQDLIKQLDMLLQSEPVAPPQSLTPARPLSPADQAPPPSPMVNAKPPEPAMPKAMSSYGGAPTVKAMRVGQHSDKVRIVVDVSSKANYTLDLDNQENLLIFELPTAQWSAARSQRFSRSPLIQSYSVEPINNGQGSRVVMTLKKATQIVKQQALPPGTNPNYRIYFDLKL